MQCNVLNASDVPLVNLNPSAISNIALVADVEAEAGAQVLAKLGSDLDGRFKTVRNEEANLGNLLADVAMAALQVSEPRIVLVQV